jgi:hypothetical protein
MADYASFRQRLDGVLRTLDVKQVQKFMQDEGQWDKGTPADPQFAMYMMIAGSLTLNELHGKASEWLLANGHEEEAQAVLGRQKRAGSGDGKSQRPRPGGGGSQAGRGNGQNRGGSRQGGRENLGKGKERN